MECNDKLFYKIVKPPVRLLLKLLYRPQIIGLENIPKDGGIVLAGNHTKWLDPVTMVSVVKRQVHFLAKIELYKGITKFIVKGMGAIPVDRKNHNTGAFSYAIEALKAGLCIGIFPEGTINRTEDIIMPFKTGAVKMAKEADASLVPFVITGEYKLFRKGIRIEFLKPIKVDDIDNSNKRLEDAVSKGIVNNGGVHGKRK